MGRPCNTCNHPNHVAIDKKLLGGCNVADLARKNGLDPSTLLRHKQSHLAKPHFPGEIGADEDFTAWSERRELATADDVLTYAKFCVFRMERLADRAEAGGDVATAVRAIGTTLKTLEGLFAKVTGLVNDGPAIDASTKIVAVLGGLTDAQILAFIANGAAVKELPHDARA